MSTYAAILVPILRTKFLKAPQLILMDRRGWEPAPQAIHYVRSTPLQGRDWEPQLGFWPFPTVAMGKLLTFFVP